MSLFRPRKKAAGGRNSPFSGKRQKGPPCGCQKHSRIHEFGYEKAFIHVFTEIAFKKLRGIRASGLGWFGWFGWIGWFGWEFPNAFQGTRVPPKKSTGPRAPGAPPAAAEPRGWQKVGVWHTPTFLTEISPQFHNREWFQKDLRGSILWPTWPAFHEKTLSLIHI